VIAEVDAGDESEWNRYDTVHLPDALRCPGVRRGRLCILGEVSETAAGKTERTARRIYTTIYELDSPDAIATRSPRHACWYSSRRMSGRARR